MTLKNLTFEWPLSLWLRQHHIFQMAPSTWQLWTLGLALERRAILVQTKKGFFIGPDNGILILAAKNQGLEHIYELTNPKLMLPKISNTFHGRDIFAPAAAYLDKDVKPKEFGAEIKDLFEPEFQQD